MITSYTEESSTKKTARIEIPAAEMAAASDAVARELAREVRLPGFRPGKVPLDVVRKRFPDEIRRELLEGLVRDSIREVWEGKGLHPVGEPKVEELKFEPGGPLTFRVDFEVRPVVQPKDYRGLKVPTESTAVAESDIEAVLTRLRQAHAAYEPVENRPAADGDFALVDIGGNFPNGDGKDFEHEKVLVEIGSERTMPEVSANLRNAEVGMRTAFQKDFPPEAEDPDFAGKTVLYTLAFHALKSRQLPEVDDEFAKTVLTPREGDPPAGANLAMLRDQIQGSIERDKVAALKEKRRRAVLDGLLALHDVEAPSSMVEMEVDDALKNYARHLASQGVDLKEAKIDWKAVRQEAHPSAERRVKEYLLLDAIGDAEKIEVTDVEINAHMKLRAMMSGMSLQEVQEAFGGKERMEGLREELRIDKVVEFLLSEATPATLG
jgi:trigger factor